MGIRKTEEQTRIRYLNWPTIRQSCEFVSFRSSSGISKSTAVQCRPWRSSASHMYRYSVSVISSRTLSTASSKPPDDAASPPEK